MTNKEYAELLDYVSKRSNELDNTLIYKVHSSYDPKSNEVYKVTLKLNYTKDLKPLPDLNGGKITKSIKKNFVERTEHFRNDTCKLDYIKTWIDSFMNTRKEV